MSERQLPPGWRRSKYKYGQPIPPRLNPENVSEIKAVLLAVAREKRIREDGSEWHVEPDGFFKELAFAYNTSERVIQSIDWGLTYRSVEPAVKAPTLPQLWRSVSDDEPVSIRLTGRRLKAAFRKRFGRNPKQAELAAMIADQ